MAFIAKRRCGWRKHDCQQKDMDFLVMGAAAVGRTWGLGERRNGLEKEAMLLNWCWHAGVVTG